MRAFLRALAAAISSALAGSWRFIDGIWTFVRTAVGGGSSAVGPIFEYASECRTSDVSEVDLGTGIKGWAKARASGLLPRLPSGITPAAAVWATRLHGAELETVARSSPEMIASHIDGSRAIAEVRPALVMVDEDAEKRARLAALRARGASLRAAVDRSLEASADRATAHAM